MSMGAGLLLGSKDKKTALGRLLIFQKRPHSFLPTRTSLEILYASLQNFISTAIDHTEITLVMANECRISIPLI